MSSFSYSALPMLHGSPAFLQGEEGLNTEAKICHVTTDEPRNFTYSTSFSSTYFDENPYHGICYDTVSWPLVSPERLLQLETVSMS